MATVYLHIGAMKSGTSYLQNVLSTNKTRLLEHGVLIPGKRWRDQAAAAEDVTGIHPKGKQPNAGAWTALVEEILGFDGTGSVFSMETLAAGDAAAARRVVESFPGYRVRVILTARDLGRVVPAQWQESLKNGATLSYDKFLALLAVPGGHDLPGARAFWGPQDLGRILRRWQPLVPREDLVLVTVAPRGADRALLWERFREAAELPDFDADLSVKANESLGQASAELMRQVNLRAKELGLPFEVTNLLKPALAKRILAARADQEQPVAVPKAYRSWVAGAAERIVDDLVDIDPVVIGDLNDLRVPEWQDPQVGRVRSLRARLAVGDEARVGEDEVNKAALDAILGLIQRLAKEQGRAPRRP